MSKRQYKFVPPFVSIEKDISARLIPENKLQDGSNVIFRDGRVSKRWGYRQLGNQQLSGAIVGIYYVEFLKYLSKFLIVFSTRDAYRFNFSTGRYDYITEIFCEGTCSCAGSTPTSTVTLTSAIDYATYDKVNTYWIKFGNKDPNLPGTWYQVVSITAATSLTITGNVTHGASTEFVIRLCFSGDADTPFYIATPIEPERAEKVLIASNGIDYVVRWDGEGYFYPLRNTLYTEGTLTAASTSVTLDDPSIAASDLFGGMTIRVKGDTGNAIIPINTTITGNSHPLTMSNAALAGSTGKHTLKFIGNRVSRAKHISFFGALGFEHIIFASINNEDGNIKQRIELSDGASLWFGGTYYDLLASPDNIQGIVPLQTRFMIYKDQSISEMNPNPAYDNDNPFMISQNKINTGTSSIRTVQNTGQFHLFFSNDNILAFDGINIVPVGTDVTRDLRSKINRPYAANAFSGMIFDEDLYVLFIPNGEVERILNQFSNKAYVYNYRDKSWTIWDFKKDMNAFAQYRSEFSPAWSLAIDSTVTKTDAGLTINTDVITMASTAGLSIGMNVRGDNIPRKSYDTVPVSVVITAINTGPTSITINANAIASGTNQTIRCISGRNMDDQELRFEDMILFSNNLKYLLGDVDGYVYDFSSLHRTDGDDTLDASFVTKDYPLNDPKMNFMLLGCVLSFLTTNGESIKIRASVDFGQTWTGWDIVPLDGVIDYKEHIINYLERGKQVRFEIKNIDSGSFNIETMTIEYSDMGVTLDN